jgi:O-antigen ligase
VVNHNQDNFGRVAKDPLSSLAFLLVALASMGVAFYFRTFAKIRVGPLYILDATALTSAVLLLPALHRIPWRDWLRPLWPLWLFFGWGCALFLGDAMRGGDYLHQVPASRWIQHSILFVYPAVWTSLGAALYRVNRVRSRVLVLLVFGVAVLPNFWARAVYNISLGPLSALLLLVLIYRYRNRRDLLGIAVFSALAFVPFWRMWLHYFQRTLLVTLFFLMAVVPFAWRTKSEPVAKAFRTSLTAVLIFVSGIVATSAYVGDLNFFDSFLRASRHGDDVSSTDGSLFPANFRRFLWLDTIEQWKASPWIGLGFVPDLPKNLPSGPNVGGFEFPGAPPVSGPHNSYLGVLARMGVVGLALLGVVLGLGARAIHRSVSRPERTLFGLLLIFLPVNGAIHAFFNIGFESPHNSMVMWLVFGMLVTSHREVRE